MVPIVAGDRPQPQWKESVEDGEEARGVARVDEWDWTLEDAFARACDVDELRDGGIEP